MHRQTLGIGRISHLCWKPGLASKRIATRVGVPSQTHSESRAPLETRTRFKEDCDTFHPSPSWADRSMNVLETRTRFKEDCDRQLTSFGYERAAQSWKPGLASKRIATARVLVRVGVRVHVRGWKPGLASKRIATLWLPRRARVGATSCWKPGLASKRIATEHPLAVTFRSVCSLETRTRFKEDCDPRMRIPRLPLGISTVGNQDSLQRGLRPHLQERRQATQRPCELETRTRFKEDCDARTSATYGPPRFDRFQLETRTRFKEDCDHFPRPVGTPRTQF